MYVYDLKKTDVSSALSVTEDVRKLELVYREWKTFSAENSLDTFSGMADGDYWNSLINSGKDGKETAFTVSSVLYGRIGLADSTAVL